jgi:hypothetical protein
MVRVVQGGRVLRASPERSVVVRDGPGHGEATSGLPSLRVLLDRLDSLLRAAVAAMPAEPDPFRGLYLTQDDAATLAASGDSIRAEGDAIARLAAAFHLDRLEVDVLVVALAPEIDLRYQRLFGYLQDDITCTRPSVGFALDLATAGAVDRSAALLAIAEDSSLVRSGLVRIVPDGRHSRPPLAAHVLVPDRQVLRWVTRGGGLDPRVAQVLVAPDLAPVIDSLGAMEVDAARVVTAEHPQDVLDAACREACYREVGVDLRHASLLMATAGGSEMVDRAQLVLVDQTLRLDTTCTERPLGRLGHVVSTAVGWDDLVLPAVEIQDLRELCARVSNRDLVLDDWGFGSTLLGRGVIAMFAGPPGTGKTLAARVVAGVLGLPLHRVDLGQVVDKFIGETEKNFDRIFERAADEGVVLLFDEADALFGRRTDVRDAHDRYANLEVSHLMARIEEFDGLAILTTNLREHMDQAFARRLSATVRFPFPDEVARRRIWSTLWPSSAPLAHDVSFDRLARHRLSGAEIRNACLTAAFLAASAGGVTTVAHLDEGIRREMASAGRRHEPTMDAVGA